MKRWYFVWKLILAWEIQWRLSIFNIFKTLTSPQTQGRECPQKASITSDRDGMKSRNLVFRLVFTWNVQLWWWPYEVPMDPIYSIKYNLPMTSQGAQGPDLLKKMEPTNDLTRCTGTRSSQENITYQWPHKVHRDPIFSRKYILPMTSQGAQGPDLLKKMERK